MSATYSNSSKNSKSNNRAKVQSPENFLDALKTLGKSTVTEAKVQIQNVIKSDIPESFGIAPKGGTMKPNESFSLDDLKSAENRGRQKSDENYARQLQQMNEQARSKLIQQENTAKQQINSIREEILKLAKSMGDLAQEVEVATMQAPTNPGVYHKNFFSHLKSMITLLRMRVDSSKNWLASSNARAKRKGGYWSQVKSSGTKFMLSSERYMVTSTG